MKRLFTLLLTLLTAFTLKTVAQPGTNCNANFGFQVSGTTGYFSPAEIGDSLSTRHAWYFGDGSPVSTQPAPAHTYPSVTAMYQVKHVFQRFNSAGGVVCSDTVTKMLSITSCNITANFSFVRDSLQPNKVYFTNLSTPSSGINYIQWTFGDGTSSNAPNPVHEYANSGAYNVCLIVKDTTLQGCTREICKIVQVQAPATCNLQANFGVFQDSLQTNLFHFNNTTVNFQPGDSLFWDYGDGSTSVGNTNPTHVYPQPGTYTVCLKVKRNMPSGAAPCVSQICKTILVPGAPCNLQAYFTWRADSLQTNRIYFTNATVNFQPGDSIRWTFGDGTTSYDINPVHVFAQPGTYNVCIRVKRNTASGTTPCVSEICKTVVVTANNTCNVQPAFVWRADSSQYNKIYFTNTTINLQPGDSIRWIFGDGTFSNDLNPTHIYAQPGVYNACLSIRRFIPGTTISCAREYCLNILVTTPCNLTVNFSWTTDSLQQNKIRFNNLSTPLANTDSIRWTFGDGTSSSDVNPTHVYAQPGIYTVCLRVKKNGTTPAGTACVREICKTVVVQAPPCTIQPNFTWTIDSSNNRLVYFSNLTQVPAANATAKWNFGDGTTATSWNASHQYAQTGTYIVCLTVQTSNTCIRTICDTIIVAPVAPPCSQMAAFSFTRSTSDYQTYLFTPAYTNPALTYTWTFGDGTGSQQMSPLHRYTQPGTYTVCLTVFRNSNCVATSCKQVSILPQVICDSIRVTYVTQRDAFMPNKVYFYAVSNFPILQQKWTITRLPATSSQIPVTLYQNNPVYIFQDSGTYRVCLRAVTLGGCIKEYCQNITITQVPPQQCQLVAYPNPTQGVVNVNVQLTQPQMIYAYVYSAQNILVKQKQQQGTTGNNVVSLNVGDLVPGFYTIRLVYGNRVCYAKFQKL